MLMTPLFSQPHMENSESRFVEQLEQHETESYYSYCKDLVKAHGSLAFDSVRFLGPAVFLGCTKVSKYSLIPAVDVDS